MDFDIRPIIEFGVTSGLLISIIIYILKWHIPTLIRTFEEGFHKVAVALKDVNTQLLGILKRIDHMQERILDKADGEWKEHAKECRDIAKESTDTNAEIVEEVRELKDELKEMKQQVFRVLEAISKIL